MSKTFDYIQAVVKPYLARYNIKTKEFECKANIGDQEFYGIHFNYNFSKGKYANTSVNDNIEKIAEIYTLPQIILDTFEGAFIYDIHRKSGENIHLGDNSEFTSMKNVLEELYSNNRHFRNQPNHIAIAFDDKQEDQILPREMVSFGTFPSSVAYKRKSLLEHVKRW